MTTQQKRQAMRLQLRNALMSIQYEFKYRHSSKVGRYSPKDNISEYIKFIRSMRKVQA